MRLEATESEIERLILDYLHHLKDCFVWKNVTNGYYDAKIGRYRRQVSPYAIKGVADILGIYRGRPIAIEVKSRSGRPTIDQVDFLQRFVDHGGIAGICRSLEDVQKLLLKT